MRKTCECTARPGRRRIGAVLLAVGGLAVFLASARGLAGELAAAGSGGAAVGGSAAPAARTAVEAVLARQQAAWNRGDLVAFTAGYAEDATFLSPAGITHGRADVLARYQRRYPDRGAMGTLGLQVLEARSLGDGAMSVAAHWRISHPGEPGRLPAEGSTLLVLRQRQGGWEIVQDASM
jgi:uncharacterized protein (TIGR02246 family)